MAHFVQLVLGALFEAYVTFMPLRIVLWTFAAIVVAFFTFVAAHSLGLIGT